MTSSVTAGGILPPDAELRRAARRAYVAAGIGWGLDGLTWTLYGFALTAIGPVLGISTEQKGWITALSIVASAFGGAIGGVLADRYGRVRILTVVILGYCLFTALTATSQNVEQFVLWRILEGLAFGAEWAVGAALVAEYAPSGHRSRILSAVHSCYVVGWALSTALYLIVFSVFDPAVAWRYLFLVGVIPGVVAFWIRLTVKDRFKLRAQKGTLPLLLLFVGRQRRITLLATLLGVGIQGINYSVLIFLPLYLRDERGVSVVGTASYTWVVIVGSFLGYLASGHIHDALGRRRSFALLFVAAAASTALFILTPVARPGTGIVVCFVLGFFTSAQCGGIGAYLAELFPTEMRASGQGLAYNAGRGIAAFGPLFVGVFASGVGFGNAILLVAAASTLIALTSLALLPETRNSQIVGAE